MPTLKDVAALAGVSPITVSRVINDPETVKPKTRQRVEAAMTELHYVPNAAAKYLASNRTGVINVYIPKHIDLSNPFVMHLITGISDVLSERMYSMLILRDRSKERMCDGYIVTGLFKDEINDFVIYAQERQRPVVLFGHTNLPGVTSIDVDNVLGACQAARHLLDLGHRRIAMINVREDKDYVADRQAGWQKAFSAMGLPFNENDVFFAVNSVEGGVQAVCDLPHPENYTAFLCATDTIAIGVAAELRRIGRAIPQDASIVGFDGLGHELLSPVQLDTVRQPVFEVGRMLAHSLINRLDGEEVPQETLVAPSFVPGGSTAPYHG